jgi:hypothetical protein
MGTQLVVLLAEPIQPTLLQPCSRSRLRSRLLQWAVEPLHLVPELVRGLALEASRSLPASFPVQHQTVPDKNAMRRDYRQPHAFALQQYRQLARSPSPAAGDATRRSVPRSHRPYAGNWRAGGGSTPPSLPYLARQIASARDIRSAA